MLQLLWALMTWRQRRQMEASAWAPTKTLDTKLQAASVPSLLIYNTVIADGIWSSLAPDHVERRALGFFLFVCFFFVFFFTIGCWKLSVNQTVIGRISPLLSGPVSFAVADVAENRQDVNSSPQGVSNASPSFSLFFRLLPLSLALRLS